MDKDILKILKLTALIIVILSTLIFIGAYLYIHRSEIKKKWNSLFQVSDEEEAADTAQGLLERKLNDEEISREELISDYKRTVSENKFIIHALGGMEGRYSYVNSIDCLQTAYEAGYRLFEADISFTSDNVLVLAHSAENNIWTKNDWDKRLGQPFPKAGSGANPEKHLCDYATFMTFKIQGRFKATDLAEIFDFMEEHTDMYLMVDAGKRSYEDTLAYYQELVKVAEGRTSVLNHLIAGGQTTDMVKAAREVYDFLIINLYYDSDDKREEILKTPEDFLNYCKEYGIVSYSTSKDNYTEKVAGILSSQDSGLTGYVFTVNDGVEEGMILQKGDVVIGTDYLWSK
ncbi:MAG: hypothetical protein IKS48_06175 [Eubacterium sp.]|nr:hypothetical protein [Eubacterium sp.]